MQNSKRGTAANNTENTAMNVTTKLNDQTVSVEYNFGSNLEESVAIFGEDRVHDHFVRNAKIALQGYMSRQLKAGKNPDEVAASIADFTLEGRRPAKSKADKAADLFAAMSPEEQAAFKKLLKGG